MPQEAPPGVWVPVPAQELSFSVHWGSSGKCLCSVCWGAFRSHKGHPTAMLAIPAPLSSQRKTAMLSSGAWSIPRQLCPEPGSTLGSQALRAAHCCLVPGTLQGPLPPPCQLFQCREAWTSQPSPLTGHCEQGLGLGRLEDHPVGGPLCAREHVRRPEGEQPLAVHDTLSGCCPSRGSQLTEAGTEISPRLRGAGVRPEARQKRGAGSVQAALCYEVPDCHWSLGVEAALSRCKVLGVTTLLILQDGERWPWRGPGQGSTPPSLSSTPFPVLGLGS